MANLHMNSLQNEFTQRGIEGALEKLPPKLNDAYHTAWQRIESRYSPESLIQKAVFLVAYARRPLSVEELEVALTIHIGDKSLDKKGQPKAENLVKHCEGLLTIDNSNHVRLLRELYSCENL